MWHLSAFSLGVAGCCIFGCGSYEPAGPGTSRPSEGQSRGSGVTPTSDSAPQGPPLAVPVASAGPQTGAAAPQGGGAAPFLDQKKQVPPRGEWNKDIVSRRGGAVLFRVTSQGPFAVTVVTDRAYKALVGGGDLRKEDGLLSIDSKGPAFEGRVTVPPGSSWFIIENQARQTVEMHLQCFASE